MEFSEVEDEMKDASLPACQLYMKRGYRTVRYERWDCDNGAVLVYGIMEKNV